MEDHLNQLINKVYVQKKLAQKAQLKQLFSKTIFASGAESSGRTLTVR